MQVSESEMERTLFMLINGCEINDKLWEDVANMFNGLTRQPKAAQLSFYNSLLDTLWTRGFGERACRVLRHAKEKQVYDDSFYIFSKSEWCLDLHRWVVCTNITSYYFSIVEAIPAVESRDSTSITIVTSKSPKLSHVLRSLRTSSSFLCRLVGDAVYVTLVNMRDLKSCISWDEKLTAQTNVLLCRLSVGGAITMLTVWLGELHHALVWGEDAPESVVIVTGKGSHSKSKSSVLKTPVDLQLAQLCSPFTDVVGNCGRVSASGDDVQNWLLSPCTSQRLRLVDVEYCDNRVVSSRRTS